MTEIQKLRYDLAMNCALIKTQAEYQKKADLNLHTAMWENFQHFYQAYALFGQENDMKQFMEDLLHERLVLNPASAVSKVSR